MSTLDPLYKCIIVEEEVAPSDTTIDFTGPSGWGTPTFAILFWGQSNVGGGAPRVAAWNYGNIGFWTSTGQCNVGWAEESAVATSNCSRSQSSTHIVYVANTSATATHYQYSASAITDGIRLTKVANLSSGSKLVQIMMFRGSSIKNVRVSNHQANAGAPINHILNGGGGWTPNFVFYMTNGNPTNNAAANDARMCFGWAMQNISGAGTGTFKQGCIAYFSNDGSATAECQQYFSGSTCLLELGGLSTVQSATASGFFTSGSNAGLSWSAETFTANCNAAYLAIEFETNLTTDPDMMIERMANWSFNEAGANDLLKQNLSQKTNNFVGACIAPGTMNSAAETVEGNGYGSNAYDCGIRISLRDSFGIHGGISWVSEDGNTTMNNGGHTQGPWYWRMPEYAQPGSGRTWQGSFFDRTLGGELVLDDAYSTLPTGYKENFTVLAFGRGIREIYIGDELAGIYSGGPTGGDTYSPQNRTAVDVYKGSTKIYGEPDHDFVDTL